MPKVEIVGAKRTTYVNGDEKNMNVEKYTPDFLVRLVESLCAYPAEQTWFEFKRNCADVMRIGEYLSGLSNAALLANQPYGYLVYGIDNITHEIVGTDFDPMCEKTKGKSNGEELVNYIQRGLHDSAVSYDVYRVAINDRRVCIFEVEAAKIRPVEFYGNGLCRVGSTLTELKKNIALEREIYSHLSEDWSARTVPGVGLGALDPEALKFARKQYAEKYRDASFADQISTWDDWTFLHRACLAIDGKLTFAALILLGTPESEHWISPSIARITWNLLPEEGRIRDYCHFKPPMILAVDQVFNKIRNLTMREMPDGTLFPKTFKQYDHWVFREALHNCIAHQDYSLTSSISVAEYPDRIELSNAGEFAPGTLLAVLRSKDRPRRYRNRQLVDAMVELKMIDTAGMGIQTMFEKQRDNAMPLPDYHLKDREVRVVIPGTVLDMRYSQLLLDHAGLPMEHVFLLDHIQKGVRITKEEAKTLKSLKLIEGRYPSVYPAARIASKTGAEKNYLERKGFDTKFYKQRILEFICLKGSASIAEIFDLLKQFLPQGQNEASNKRRVANLLSASMAKRDGCICTEPRISKWKLTKKGSQMCRNGNVSCRRICPECS